MIPFCIWSSPVANFLIVFLSLAVEARSLSTISAAEEPVTVMIEAMMMPSTFFIDIP